MRILIDECLDWRLGRALVGHECLSVMKMGWTGIKNGRILALAENEFDVFMTGDRNLSFQQHLPSMHIAVIVLAGKGTQLRHTLTLMDSVLEILPRLQSGDVRVVS